MVGWQWLPHWFETPLELGIREETQAEYLCHHFGVSLGNCHSYHKQSFL